MQQLLYYPWQCSGTKVNMTSYNPSASLSWSASSFLQQGSCPDLPSVPLDCKQATSTGLHSSDGVWGPHDWHYQLGNGWCVHWTLGVMMASESTAVSNSTSVLGVRTGFPCQFMPPLCMVGRSKGSDMAGDVLPGAACGAEGRAPPERGGRGCDHSTGWNVWVVLHHKRSKDNELIYLFHLVMELKNMEMPESVDEM